MEDLTVQLGSEALALVGLIAVIVQQCKRSTYLMAVKEKMPVFVMAAIVLGIVAAYFQEMPNFVIAGTMMGLMASGAYSASKNNKNPAGRNGK